MGRYRPPAPRASPYITPAGFDALQAELKALWPRRAEVVSALAAAAAEGDRSENAEYVYRKKELAGIDRRIRYLQKRLPDLKVVRDAPAPDRVFFGARVTLERPDGGQLEYRLVGADEADPGCGAISVDAPLARALRGRALDDEVELTLGAATEQFAIVAIRYD